MAHREVVVGGMAGRIIGAAYAHLVRLSRKGALEHIASDHHRPVDDPRNAVKFFDVYQLDGVISEEAMGQVGWRPAVTPEMVFDAWVIERVEVIHDSNSQEEPGLVREVIGRVLFRHYDDDRRTLRFKVQLVGNVNAHHGYTWFNQQNVSSITEGSSEDLQLNDLAKKYVPLATDGLR